MQIRGDRTARGGARAIVSANRANARGWCGRRVGCPGGHGEVEMHFRGAKGDLVRCGHGWDALSRGERRPCQMRSRLGCTFAERKATLSDAVTGEHVSFAASAFGTLGATLARSDALFFRAVTCDLRNRNSVDRKGPIIRKVARKAECGIGGKSGGSVGPTRPLGRSRNAYRQRRIVESTKRTPRCGRRGGDAGRRAVDEGRRTEGGRCARRTEGGGGLERSGDG